MAAEKPTAGASCPVQGNSDTRKCQGVLDSRGALAVPHAAVQPNDPTLYRQDEALAQGTLFPCLNLPFYLKVNGTPVPATPLTELQALHFVVSELALYLDTHADDAEAFALFQRYAALEQQARTTYEEQFGPLTQRATAAQKGWKWIGSPWPWDVGMGGE